MSPRDFVYAGHRLDMAKKAISKTEAQCETMRRRRARRRRGHGCNRRSPVRACTGASPRRRDLERPAVKRRRQSPGSRPKGRTTRVKYDCLDVLTRDEAQTVLNDLLSSR